MRRVYRIFLSRPGGTSESLTRRRADAAAFQAERLAYEEIKSLAGLDTVWGWKAMDAVRAIDPRRGGTAAIRDSVLYVTPSHEGGRP